MSTNKVTDTQFRCHAEFTPASSKHGIYYRFQPGIYEVEFVRENGINVVSKNGDLLVYVSNEEVQKYGEIQRQ